MAECKASLLHTDKMEATRRKVVQFFLKKANAAFLCHCVEAAFDDLQG